ncbi:efflux RND transporter periplasmic adaptor subunit [Rhizobium sp. G187]|uniref:efflux RND transporter periplasmic adaptor subunit n=1 Tax=unclassified Rhizobium TaxID=2613769 RepID=UPI0006B8C926|nr:efflux RND transporter periplasmic adaptor subunit [Rhizobium sp. AAP43]KPF45791.1 hemolysin secretion protein D [Rhizobium sp. AAP43]
MSLSFSSTRLVLPLLAVLTLSACTEEQAEAPTETPSRPVKVVEVAPAAKARELRYSGIVKARSEAATGFRVAGKITERLVDIGDRVVAGEVLARLDVADYVLQLKSAEANLASAERQVETAAFAKARAEALFRQQVSTKAQLEQAELSFNQAVANRDSARSSLEQAQNQVGYGELKADRPGIVTAINADAGQVVPAGNPVVTLAADGEKEVLIAVPENEILAFSVGKKVDVGLWSKEGLKLEGTVREVAGSADPASRTFSVRISVSDNPDILLGMTARVVAQASAEKELFELPLSALARDAENAPIVWAVERDGQTVHSRRVTLETFSEAGVQISQGVSAGDIVIVAGTQFMREDLKVALEGDTLSQLASGELTASTR